MRKSTEESGKRPVDGAIDLVVIGGSAGSLPILIQILKGIDSPLHVPVVVVIHRQRNVVSELVKILSTALNQKSITEPDDKEAINAGYIYIAPQNYHLLIEKDKTFSLDYSEAIKYSRPSIDVTFESAGRVYNNKVAAIILSGANNDGCAGLNSIVKRGGIAIAQAPSTAEYPVMPQAAAKQVKDIKVYTPEEIAGYLKGLVIKGK